MNKVLLLAAVAATLSLAACDRDPVVVNTPPSTVPGPAGPAGATGDAGATGATGYTGSTGAAGDKGESGEAGKTGGGTVIVVPPAEPAK